MITAIVGVTVGFALSTSGIIQPDSPPHHSAPDSDEELQIEGGYANVTANGTVDYINLTVTKGESEVNFGGVSILWSGVNRSVSLVGYPNGTTTQQNTVQPGESQRFYVSPIYDTDESFPVLNTESDRFRVTMNVTAIEGHPIDASQRIALKFTLANRKHVQYAFRLPDSLHNKSVVEI
ncbi:hypothetical protein [Halorussus lipolyticus]|uniref:hypothetical protein n=1 Tax=Halorussus lipolyticus TaxID=3034024 RepID=UPI0023E85AF3|nr:hypothetical protein [Halorussus sp. DT80]